MIRFEELQMRLVESAKNYLDIFDLATLVEQYSLNKESKITMSLPELRQPYPLSATVSFSYDVEQSSLSSLSDPDFDENIDYAVDIEILIHLPFVQSYNEIADIYDEIADKYEELEPLLVKKEFYGRNEIAAEEYEIMYSITVDQEDIDNPGFFEEMFFDLGNILKLIYDRSKFYIDMTWYGEKDD